MPPSSTLTEQLAILGIHLPAWPEEPEGGGAAGDWIQRGQAYAEGMRLLRAQLLSAAAFDTKGGERLISTVQCAGRQSAWQHRVIRYLLIDLQGGSDYQRVHAAAKLVAADCLTAAQRLGAALELARESILVCAVEAIKQLVEVQQVSEQDCLDLCALLVTNLQPEWNSAGRDLTGEGLHWLQNVEVYLQATSMLATAARAGCGEWNRAALVSQLESLLNLAAARRPRPESDERAAIRHVRTRERRPKALVQTKPLLRTIHHLACTGGTVISKCLAAMPDVAVISEVNPFNRSGNNFEPANPMLLLEKSYRTLSTDEIVEEFVCQIGRVFQICHDDDVDLIIRDHSHTDFCLGTAPSMLCPIADCLGDDYELLSVVTVRHPLDSYLGMLDRGWERLFSPSSLEEYSRRYLAFVDRYASLPTLRYEDFCAESAVFMKNLCDIMKIDYSDEFIGRFGAVALSGDSGRKGVETIEPRPRRAVPEEVQVEIENSRHYAKLLERLGY